MAFGMLSPIYIIMCINLNLQTIKPTLMMTPYSDIRKKLIGATICCFIVGGG